MPRILELDMIDGELWCRVGKLDDLPSGVTLWTPDEKDAALQAAADDALERAEKAVINPDNRLHPDLHCSKEEREEFIEKLNKGDNGYFYGRGQSTATKWQVAAIRALKSQKSHTE